jgi:hypothetical protein
MLCVSAAFAGNLFVLSQEARQKPFPAKTQRHVGTQLELFVFNQPTTSLPAAATTRFDFLPGP